MNIKEKITQTALNHSMNYITKNPEENLPKLLNWLDENGKRKQNSSFRPGR
ncbi:MAG: hypothetical protein ACI4J7_00055 [Ruminiclostridium sp.]